MKSFLQLIFLLSITAISFAQPVNDDCSNAISLTASANNTCNPVAGTNVGVVSTDYDPCAEFSKRNVWYKFTASASTHIVQVSFGSMQQGIINAFANGCGTLTALNCGGLGESGPVIQKILNGLTIGQEYLIAVSTRDESNEGTFDICITTPQAPLNDDCVNAQGLTVNASNIPAITTAATTLFASQSMPACTGVADDDVWFKFTATQATHRIFLIYTNSFFSVEAFSGSCGSLNSIACASPSGINKTISLTGLNPGEQYFIRVYSNSGSASSQDNFSIAITSAAINDECTGATIITPSANESCISSVRGSTIDATQSSLDCFGGNSTSNDTWFQFVATQSVHKLKVFGFGNNVLRFEMFSGGCGALNSLSCSVPLFDNDTAFKSFGGLNAGQTYFIRVYSGNSGGVEGLFNVCVSSPVFPVNDDCITAVTLVPSTDSSTNYINGTLTEATALASTGNCSAGQIDVWYKFVASAPQHIVKAINLTNNSSLMIELFSGNCGALVHQKCANPGDTLFGIGNLNIGDTYFIKISSGSLIANDDFKIAVFTPQALINDECTGAIAIVPSADATCNEVGGTILGATQSFKDNPCSGNPLIGQVSDVWFKFVASSSSHRIRLTKATGTVSFQLMSGSCGSLTSLGCSSELTGVAGSATEVRYNGLTIGQTYYIRVLNTAPSTTGSFDLCVKSVVVPVNNECASPIILTPQSGITFGQFISSSTIDATQSSQPTQCSTGEDDDVWFQVTATQPNMQVVIINTSLGSASRAAVYSGSCGALTLVKCQSGTQRDNIFPLTGLNPGTNYLIRVYSSSTSAASQGTFSIMVTTEYNQPVNDDCSNAIELIPAITCNPTKGSTIDAGASGNATCVAGNEVWYKFIATANAHRVNVEGFINAPVITIFSGSCAGLVQISGTCTPGITGASANANGLTIGNTYFIKVLASNNGAFAQSFFNICVTTPQIPLNNDCANAIDLAIDNDASLTHTTIFTTNLATFTGVPTCSVFGNDIWFKFTAPAEAVSIEANGLTNNVVLELLSGGCSSLSSLRCGATSVNNINNIINTGGLIAGNVYLIRASAPSFSAPVDFTLKIYKNPSIKINNRIDSTCLLNNIVQNPSLEKDGLIQPSFVPAADPGTEFIYNWRVPTRGTSDFFNALNNAGSAVEVPFNFCFGTQSPRNGYGYAGFFAYSSSANSYREYLENELAVPMTVNKKYLVSFYVSLSDFSTIGIDNLGVAFRTTQTKELTLTVLPFTPLVVSADNQFLADKSGWINITGIVTADQPYKYLIIGNFKNNAATDTVRLKDTTGLLSGGTFSGCASVAHTAYYFVDDVLVAEIDQSAGAQCAFLSVPLRLLSFTGKKQNSQSLLQWQTTNEHNTLKFEVQRSEDGSRFLSVGEVMAKNKPGNYSYEFRDVDPLAGRNFYRLKQVDVDGKFVYSATIKVDFDKHDFIINYSNPFSQQINIAVPHELAGAMLSIHSSDGKLVYQKRVTESSLNIQTSNWTNAVYIIQFIKDGIKVTRKLIKQ